MQTKLIAAYFGIIFCPRWLYCVDDLPPAFQVGATAARSQTATSWHRASAVNAYNMVTLWHASAPSRAAPSTSSAAASASSTSQLTRATSNQACWWTLQLRAPLQQPFEASTSAKLNALSNAIVSASSVVSCDLLSSGSSPSSPALLSPTFF